MTTHQNLLTFQAKRQAPATLTIRPDRRSAHTVHPYLYGKFCEHLRYNIYHGMDAQLVLNPTFAAWSFGGTRDALNQPDGGLALGASGDRIALQARHYSEALGAPPVEALLRDLADGLAFGWVRSGDPADVVVSPDVGPHGGRAQRLESFGATPEAPQGLRTWQYLPLHRTRGYEFRLVGRAYRPVTVRLALAMVDADEGVGEALATAEVALTTEWQTVCGELVIPAAAEIDPTARYELSVTVAEDANVVLDRLLLYPDDHLHHADREVIGMLRDAKLPLLRWPGGNFVSGYHWRDGVGPVDARPTLPNPAWEGLELNLFGTDEFMAYCEAVGCEPMICINAGNGTPQEAAEWVQYCNGGVDTPMGALRAANGHPAPYGVRLWEIGNEIYGRWQVSWTTAGGYVDRYRRYVDAMRAVDPTIEVLACGDQTGGVEREWYQRLIDEAGDKVTTITDHLLTGGTVTADTDPVALYQAFMGYATLLPTKYQALVERMAAAGITDPHVAITELQLFAHFGGPVEGRHSLRPEWLPTPATISEALYLHAMINAAIRTEGIVSMITHSATLNHGGGLRKARERVWGTPVHYGHVMGVEMADGTPLHIDLTCPSYDTDQSFGQIRALRDVPALDPMAVLGADGQTLIVTLYSRLAADEAMTVEIDPGLAVADQAEVVTLTGEAMVDQNTLEDPNRIVPVTETVSLSDGVLALSLAPYSLVRVTFTLA